MDRLTSMAVFVKAVDLGSFAAAATVFDLSAPMVGKHVRFLEQRLGARLINRTTRRQSPTDLGRAYYERCRLVLAEAEAADALAGDERGEPRGTLKVAMPALFGRICVAPVLVAFARQHPALSLELSLSDPITDLAETGFDLAIRTGPLEAQAGAIVRLVARQPMAVCASPDYLARHGRPARIEELAGHQAVLYGRPGRLRPWLFPADAGPPREIMPPSRFRFDDLAAVRDAAAAGLGLAWLPRWLMREELARGALVPLLPDERPYLYDSYVLWLATPRLPSKVRLAVDALAQALPRMMDEANSE